MAYELEFEVAERPQTDSRQRRIAIVEALMATLENGQAIRVPRNGKPPSMIAMRFRSNHRIAGKYVVRSQADDHYVTLWLEPKGTAQSK